MSRPPVLFRLDGASFLGYGHIYQSLSLAAEFRKAGREAVFVMKRHEHEPLALVEREGYPVLPLAPGADEAQDAREVVGHARRLGVGLVVVDHHELGHGHMEALRDAGLRTLYIDDAGTRSFSCDVLVNYNLYAKRLDLRTEPRTRRLLGPRFALLRGQFQRDPDLRPESRRHLLVTLGGGFARGMVLKVLEGLRLLDRPLLERLAPRVLLGPGYPEPEEVIRRHDGGPIAVLRSGGDMRTHMEAALFAVSGAGGTLYELARMGVPAALVVLDDNQRLIAQEFVEQGLAKSLGWHEDVYGQAVASAVTGWARDPDGLRALRERLAFLVDGKGCERVAAAALELEGGRTPC